MTLLRKLLGVIAPCGNKPARMLPKGMNFRRPGFRGALGYLRAQRNALSTRQPVEHIDIIDRLLVADLQLPSEIGQGMVPTHYRAYLEDVVRQRLYEVYRSVLYSEFMYVVFNKHDADASIALPLPQAWRIWVCDQGLPLNERKSQREWWYLLLSNYFIQGIRRSVRLILDSRSQRSFAGAHAVIVNAPARCVPDVNEKHPDNHRGLANWYLNSSLRLPDEKVCAQIDGISFRELSNDLFVVNRVFAGLPNLSNRLRFAAEAIWLIFSALVQGMIGRWWCLVILRDAVELAYFRQLHQSQIATTYCFLDPNFCKRPLWTFAAEAHGARVMLLLYSLNYEAMLLKNFDPPPKTPGWSLANWPYYIVWEVGQANFIRFCVKGQPQILEVGSIDLEDNGASLPDMIVDSGGKAVLAVFDVAVYRPMLLAATGWPQVYYKSKTLEQFFCNVYKVAQNAGYIIAFKQKRPNVWTSGRYRRAIAKFQALPGVCIIDPSISAARVIEVSQAVISLPFTSTGFIAADKGKPSIYFDPTGEVVSAENKRHGVDMINNMQDLEDWLGSVG